MFVRCWVLYVFLHLIDKVSLQSTIKGVVGGSVTLPCLFKERELKSKEINIFWRHKGKTVYDIEQGKPSTIDQDFMFKDRIESFPLEYVNGNFSINLKHLKSTDQGQFICSIPHVKSQQTITLQVNDAVPAPEPTMNTRNSSLKAQSEGIVTLFISVALYLSFTTLLYC